MPIEQTHELRPLTAADKADLVRRAMAAWLREGGTETPTDASRVRTSNGLAYVVLHGTSEVLAVYRIRPDNMALRRMKRWPSNING